MSGHVSLIAATVFGQTLDIICDISHIYICHKTLRFVNFSVRHCPHMVHLAFSFKFVTVSPVQNVVSFLAVLLAVY